MMKQGDLVRGMPGSPYGITDEHMKLGRVESVDGEKICIVVLEHDDASKRGLGPYPVETKWFELVGHVKPFEREEALNKLAENRNALLFYDLRDADLSGADLRDADLRDADLRDADLRDADLRGVNLSGANLRDADLSGADLRGANLRGADLRGANLRDADLRGVNLSGANLRDANLRDADLRDANLDYSVWPLWCGGLHVRTDKRIMCQLAYHFCAQDCDDPEYIAARNAILTFANQFHRVRECGILEEIK